MNPSKPSILTINGGSSSIKFAVYELASIAQLFVGEIENIGIENANLTYTIKATHLTESTVTNVPDFTTAAYVIIALLKEHCSPISFTAIGHRVVYGMKHTAPELITTELLKELKAIRSYDPEHLPSEIELIEIFSKQFPAVPQVACFDTSFHTTMPDVAKWIAIPRKYHTEGIQRYGFHGLSYAYLMEELERLTGEEKAKGKIILAHLGSGASIAAVKDGKSIDTSMGFTPASGLLMGTRTGDLDPGVAWYLMQEKKLTPKQFGHLVNHESGLMGISETSSDMRELLKLRVIDKRAAEAIELFCYQTKKWIGSFAAVLGGIDTLVFSGGIGEHTPEVRSQLCNGLAFLGIEMDEIRNMKNEPVISSDTSTVCVRVMKTNEELMIARLVCQVLNY